MGDIAYCHRPNETSPTNVTSPEIVFLVATRFWINRILTPIIFSIGAVGNLMTIGVLIQRHMKSTTNIYLTALAVTDLLYLMCFLLLSLQHYSGMDEKYLYWKTLPFIYWSIDASSGASTWLTVSFTVERYIAVCEPLRGRVSCTESRARKVIACVAILNLLATVTTPFEWKVCHKNEKQFTLDQTEFGSNNFYKLFYYWSTAFAFVFIPLLSLLIFNTLLVEAVRNSRKQQKSLTQMKSGIGSRQKQENKITMALVAVVVLFIVCQTPTAIMLMVSAFYTPPEKSAAYYYKYGLHNICNFLMCINSATNFLLYCAMSDKYRRTLIHTYFRCKSKHRRTFTVSSLASYRSSMRGSVRQPRISHIAPDKENTLRPPSVRY